MSPRLVVHRPAFVIVANYGAVPTILHVPATPPTDIAALDGPTRDWRALCGQRGQVWTWDFWNDRSRLCLRCRRIVFELAKLVPARCHKVLLVGQRLALAACTRTGVMSSCRRSR